MDEEEKKESLPPVDSGSGSESDSIFNNHEERIAEQELAR